MFLMKDHIGYMKGYANGQGLFWFKASAPKVPCIQMLACQRSHAVSLPDVPFMQHAAGSLSGLTMLRRGFWFLVESLYQLFLCLCLSISHRPPLRLTLCDALAAFKSLFRILHNAVMRR